MRTQFKRGKKKLALIAVQSARSQTHGLSEMDDGFLNAAHVPQCCPLQEEGLHTVAVQLDGLGSQVQGSGVTLAVKAVAAEKQHADQSTGLGDNISPADFKAVCSDAHPEITQGSACWSEILNNRPPNTSTSSRCPSRAIR